MTKKENAIDYILRTFDFNKVQKIMKNLNWTWCTETVPTITELTQHATDLLNKCYDRKFHFTFSGGFEARYNKYKDGDVLSLRFIVEQREVKL